MNAICREKCTNTHLERINKQEVGFLRRDSEAPNPPRLVAGGAETWESCRGFLATQPCNRLTSTVGWPNRWISMALREKEEPGQNIQIGEEDISVDGTSVHPNERISRW